MITSVFRGGDLNLHINRTTLVLILKTERVETMSNLRPISLCTVLYKVITKTIVIRLRGIMHKLFKQNQSSFIAACNILNNIIIALGAIHAMKHIKGKEGWLAVKVELEKAYDRV